MEQSNSAFELLELISAPAFCVEDGKIIYTNHTAQQCQVSLGTAISDLLATGSAEYQNFSDGCLCLMLTVADVQYKASVTKSGGYDVFVLEQQSENAHLQAMASAARELRTPLSGIMAAAEQLLPPLADCAPEKQELIAQASRHLYSILRTVTNMADADRYCNAGFTPMETLNIVALFDETVQKIQDLASDVGVTISYSSLPNAVYCLANREKLERTVLNLFSNAIKFSAPGSGIQAQLILREKVLTFSIQDSGSGIPANLRGSIFSRYLHHPTVEEGRQGLGLGMAIVCAAVHAHGGTVLLQQPENQGTRISITIPLKQRGGTEVHSSILHFDYSGELDHALLELSDALPASAYKNIL